MQLPRCALARERLERLVLPAITRADRPATPTLTTVRGAEEQGRNGVLLDAYPTWDGYRSHPVIIDPHFHFQLKLMDIHPF